MEFLPMEHRIRRDWKTWRSHLKEGKFLGYNAYLEGHKASAAEKLEKFPPHQAPEPYRPMSRDASHPSQAELGLFSVDAVTANKLERSNSVAY